jgi:hypothetical protein
MPSCHDQLFGGPYPTAFADISTVCELQIASRMARPASHPGRNTAPHRRSSAFHGRDALPRPRKVRGIDRVWPSTRAPLYLNSITNKGSIK